jgi:hypothetical protein
LAKNNPLSTRTMTMPGMAAFSGWRSRSANWSAAPGTRPSSATWGLEARYRSSRRETAIPMKRPSVASGRSSNSPVRNSRVMIVITATKRPDSCVRAPADPFTAVFDRLPFTTMPLDRPAPMFAAPSPISSRLGST